MEKSDKNLRVKLSITNIIISDLEATATINLAGSLSDSFKMDTVELTGLLYNMINACKRAYENDEVTYIPEPKIKRTGHLGHYRVWTEEEKQKASETRKKKALITKLTSNNSDSINNGRSDRNKLK